MRPPSPGSAGRRRTGRCPPGRGRRSRRGAVERREQVAKLLRADAGSLVEHAHDRPRRRPVPPRRRPRCPPASTWRRSRAGCAAPARRMSPRRRSPRGSCSDSSGRSSGPAPLLVRHDPCHEVADVHGLADRTRLPRSTRLSTSRSSMSRWSRFASNAMSSTSSASPGSRVVERPQQPRPRDDRRHGCPELVRHDAEERLGQPPGLALLLEEALALGFGGTFGGDVAVDRHEARRPAGLVGERAAHAEHPEGRPVGALDPELDGERAAGRRGPADPLAHHPPILLVDVLEVGIERPERLIVGDSVSRRSSAETSNRRVSTSISQVPARATPRVMPRRRSRSRRRSTRTARRSAWAACSATASRNPMSSSL